MNILHYKFYTDQYKNMLLHCFVLLLEIEINTIEDCIGESCLSNNVGREGVSRNGEDERHNNEIGLWKNGKKRKGLVKISYRIFRCTNECKICNRK